MGGGGGNPPLPLTLVLLALAAVAAIIAADFTTSAQAQSDDETSGRIAARLLEDGRVEFGWQPTGGERVLPRQRYFPTDATVDRWLRSSPVEVGGAELGRINARLLKDGRIEFAFTPTDGERITPQARYFPAGARVGRWLRSTEIAIGPAAPGYIAVSAGNDHACAIRAGSGAIECWGNNDYGKTDAPEGAFRAVSAEFLYSCAIRESREIACWGNAGWGETDAPEGRYIAVSTGDSRACAIRESGEIVCWGGWDELQKINAPPGRFTIISTGDFYTCALRESRKIACWGWDHNSGALNAPEGSFAAVSAGDNHSCAIRSNGEIACWGSNYNGETDAPDGRFIAVSAGDNHSCAIRSNGEIACWGSNERLVAFPQTADERRAGVHRVEYVHVGQATPPPGSYTAVSAGNFYTCAIRASDGAIECWGENDYGQATPPD